jgi:hypothetical protein
MLHYFQCDLSTIENQLHPTKLPAGAYVTEIRERLSVYKDRYCFSNSRLNWARTPGSTVVSMCRSQDSSP